MTYYTPVDRQAQEVLKHFEALGIIKAHETKRARDPISLVVDFCIDRLERFIAIKVHQWLPEKREQLKLFDKSLYR